MIFNHLIWSTLTIACVVWYCTITIYVAIKGFLDIRTMLHDLTERNDNAKTAGEPTASTPTASTQKKL
jgi:hypothetical protein